MQDAVLDNVLCNKKVIKKVKENVQTVKRSQRKQMNPISSKLNKRTGFNRDDRKADDHICEMVLTMEQDLILKPSVKTGRKLPNKKPVIFLRLLSGMTVFVCQPYSSDQSTSKTKTNKPIRSSEAETNRKGPIMGKKLYVIESIVWHCYQKAAGTLR